MNLSTPLSRRSYSTVIEVLSTILRVTFFCRRSHFLQLHQALCLPVLALTGEREKRVPRKHRSVPFVRFGVSCLPGFFALAMMPACKLTVNKVSPGWEAGQRRWVPEGFFSTGGRRRLPHAVQDAAVIPVAPDLARRVPGKAYSNRGSSPAALQSASKAVITCTISNLSAARSTPTNLWMSTPGSCLRQRSSSNSHKVSSVAK